MIEATVTASGGARVEVGTMSGSVYLHTLVSGDPSGVVLSPEKATRVACALLNAADSASGGGAASEIEWRDGAWRPLA